jgi:DNA-binding winged helix-turn-helix (wHTH) protein
MSPLTGPQGNRPPIGRENVPIAKPRAHGFGGAETLEFDCFQVLLRQRVLLFETVPIELGTRAFDLLLVLLEADGALVTKAELLSRVWPGIFVAEENLKVQISALRKALGEYRGFIRTEFGRGYRFTATIHSTVDWTAGRVPIWTKGACRGHVAAITSQVVMHHRTLASRPTKLPRGRAKRLTKMARKVTLVRKTSGESDLGQ